jgi:hypothetical protein
MHTYAYQILRQSGHFALLRLFLPHFFRPFLFLSLYGFFLPGEQGLHSSPITDPHLMSSQLLPFRLAVSDVSLISSIDMLV